MTAQVETLHGVNEAMRMDTTKLPEDIEPNHNRQGESRAIKGTDTLDENKMKMQHELRNLMDKYEMMAKNIGASSSVY